MENELLRIDYTNVDRPTVLCRDLIQVYKNEQFGEVRMVVEGDKVLFCAKDVAAALGYKDTVNAIKQHCRWVVKRHLPHPQSKDKTVEMSFLPEGDVYRLVAHSKLPTSEQFEKWVFDEVIPTIHRHGVYMTPAKIEEVLLNPDTIISLATQLKAEREKSQVLLAENSAMKPKAEFADRVANTDGLLSMSNFAKVI